MFFCCGSCQRLKPVCKMSYPATFCPCTDPIGYLICHGPVYFLSRSCRRHQAFISFIAKKLPCGFLCKYILTKNACDLGRTFHIYFCSIEIIDCIKTKWHSIDIFGKARCFGMKYQFFLPYEAVFYNNVEKINKNVTKQINIGGYWSEILSIIFISNVTKKIPIQPLPINLGCHRYNKKWHYNTSIANYCTKIIYRKTYGK